MVQRVMTLIAFARYSRHITSMEPAIFLDGVPQTHIAQRLNLVGGNEIESGKLASPQSSAALAVNTFGRFCLDPRALPPIQTLFDIDWPACHVDIEYCARFPWSGGREPWLDALVQTPKHHMGIECKRFEPYRDSKKANFSKTYWRDVWGEHMQPFLEMRDALQSGQLRYTYLDAAQLVKHALGLRSDYARGHVGRPVLLYVYVQTSHVRPIKITPADIKAHQAEIADFAERIDGAEVAFAAISYEVWLASFPPALKDYAKTVANVFNLQI